MDGWRTAASSPQGGVARRAGPTRYARRAVSETTSAEPTEPKPCSPCRGTGSLISGKGGEPHTVPCPWCEGTGFEIPEHDAQAARRDAAASD